MAWGAWIINPAPFFSRRSPILRWGIRLLVAVGMGGLSAWLAFKGMPMATLWRHMWQFPHPQWGIVVLVAALMTVGWRALRWQWVIRQMAVRVTWQCTLRALWVGQMTNALLPAKLGEAAKLGLLKRGGVPIGLGAILVLVDRLLDGLSIAVLGLLGWGGMRWVGGHVSPWVGGAVVVGAVAFLVMGVAVMVMPQWGGLQKGVARCPRVVQPMLTDWVTHAQQVRKKSSMRLVLLGLGFGALNWVGEMGLLWGIAKMLGVSMPWWLAMLTVAFTAFGGLVLSAPAGVGTVHFLFMTALVSGGMNPVSAGVVTLWMHAAGIVIQVIMGAVGVGMIPVKGQGEAIPRGGEG